MAVAVAFVALWHVGASWIKPVLPAWAGRFLTAGSLGNYQDFQCETWGILGKTMSCSLGGEDQRGQGLQLFKTRGKYFLKVEYIIFC